MSHAKRLKCTNSVAFIVISDRGTEGSTKRILIGTSFGELYEYSLTSPNAAGASPMKSKSSSPFDAKAIADDIGDNEPIDIPILLHRLHASPRGGQRNAGCEGGVGSGAVGGVLFQRVMGRGTAGYVVVLASTGGAHRHTRLHAFRSECPAVGGGAGSLSLRSAFSRHGGNGVAPPPPAHVELPGSIEHPELRSCAGGFALRTETGIYYGTADRVASAVAMGSQGGSVGGDAGMLTYDSLKKRRTARGSRDGAGIVPASIGLTPHHFVMLSSDANEVQFVNRVAKRVIQGERVDWASVSQPSEDVISQQPLTAGGVDMLAAAELLTDVRRPDQIWLRRGRSLVHVSSSCEDRDVWKFTLARCIETVVPHHRHHNESPRNSSTLTSEEKQIDGQFEHAKSLCSNAVSSLRCICSLRGKFVSSYSVVNISLLP